MRTLQSIVERGGKVLFVNPGRIESAGPVTGDVILIRPDTDVYFLASLIHEIDTTRGFNEDVIARYGKNIEGLRLFAARYPAERVATVTGIPAQQIKAIARDFVDADGASTYMSTGVNQGRQGTLAYWLLNMLSFVTGNLGRIGGNYYGKGVDPTPRTDATNDVFFDTELGEMRYVHRQLPGALLAEFIEAKVDPMRALIVLSGNPLLSVAGEDRLRTAFEKLELIVSLDLYRNATGEMADYILPSADWLEREDMNHIANGVQPEPYVQYTEAITQPRADRRDDWWILANIERELGFRNMLDDGPLGYLKPIETLLSRSGLSIAALRELPHQTALLPQPSRGDFFADLIAWPDKRIDCCPELFAAGIDRCERIFRDLETEGIDALKLISLRTIHMHNSCLSNMKVLKEGRRPLNPLHINPADAKTRGLEDGDLVELASAHGQIQAAVIFDDTLRPGVVAMSHGYGHQQAPGIRRANRLPGVNVNRLMPRGPGSYEKLSNMSHMTGISVEVRKAS
jgi:anaerobic selenocysteine-containing dehydrogenase